MFVDVGMLGLCVSKNMFAMKSIAMTGIMACTPLIIYLLLAAMSLASYMFADHVDENGPSNRKSIMQQLIGHATVALIIGVLCTSGHSTGAWGVLIALLLAPFILLALAVLVLSLGVSQKNE